MYLKSLELQGFKSFADKTKIELGGGIAAVVGPNGSGKSNIVEAIQWVLGEQSAKSLRGHKMQDVIFNGTKKRKPLGMAEISIVLDNSDHALDLDFEEIKVTRRLYRSGEGEYLINGKNVRLKDIHRLFADSGIGNDGYAVIGQGRISEILESRPEDRRSIVEETAGVVKYRERKKEALQKINRADENLVRLADIMAEIESRLDPLAAEAKNAEKYLEFAAEKDQLAIGLLAETVLEAKEKLAKAETEEKEVTAAYDSLAAAIMVKEAQLTEKKSAIDLKEDVFHREEQRFHALNLEIQKSEGELKSLDSRILGYDDKRVLLHGTIQGEQEKCSQKTAAAAAVAAENATLKQKLDALRVSLAAMEDRRKSEAADLLKAEAEMELLRNSAFETTRIRGQKKNQRLAAEHRLAAAEKRLAAIAQKKAHYDEEEAVLDDRINEINDFIDGLMAEEDEVIRKERETAAAMTALKEKIRAKKDALVAVKVNLNRSEARLKVLEELMLKREGFYPGVRAVLERKAKGAYDGIFGVVAELIRVEKEYTVAIEAVLGSALQNIVTETGEDAAAAVAYLKQEKRGIATFLPLDLLRIPIRRELPQDILRDPHFRGIAADVVSAPNRVKPAVEYLLNNTLIFDDLDRAVTIAREHKGQFRILTLTGDVINSGGAMSGGSREKSRNNLLQRQTEIEELRRGLISGESQIKELDADIDDLKEKQLQLDRKMLSLATKKDSLKKEALAFDGEISNIDTRRELYARERETLCLEEEQLVRDADADKETFALIDEEIVALKAKEEKLMADISIREESFKRARSSENKDRDEYTDLQIAYAEAKAAYENSSINLNRIQNEKDALTAEIAVHQREFDETVVAKENAEQQRRELNEAILKRNRELLTFSETLDDSKGEKEALRGEAETLESEVKALNKAAAQEKDKVYQVSVKKERLLLEKEQCEEQLAEEYRLILADALPYIKKDISKKDKKERIKLLKQQIEVLGPVNLGAIEEYKAVDERFTFLTKQRDDVLEAKATLANIVAEMDEIIIRKFKEAFTAINDSFKETFPAFFQGGYGELQLTDEDNLLETGVDIIVQPPGKRLQHLSLLSGGEKALSGIALMFAILKVKPSPFYVLDEIDAALDDANVMRFGDYLQKYGTDSQFLVITHRQGTMEASETLYGVTMAEEGVSKTVSVKLV